MAVRRDLVIRARVLGRAKYHFPGDEAISVALCGATPADTGATFFQLRGDRHRFEEVCPERICKRCLKAANQGGDDGQG
jgi:hypothetical protein